MAIQARVELLACPVCRSEQERVLGKAQGAVLAQHLPPVASRRNQCHLFLAECFL